MWKYALKWGANGAALESIFGVFLELSFLFGFFSSSGEIIYPADKAIEITMGAANIVNGAVVATEKNGNATSYDLLQVNRLTGRARLIENQ